MKRVHVLAIGVPVLVLALGGWATYEWFDRGWSRPHIGLNFTDTTDTDGCWRVVSVTPPQLWRQYPQAHVLETGHLLWEEVEVFTMPDRTPIPHDRSGEVRVDDIACTTPRSQVWIYTPMGTEVARYCYIPEWTNCRAGGGTE